MSIELILGDCLEKLKTIDAKSVQTCVTSPPYYGLRDYGTATWQGGNALCNHKNGTLQSDKSTLHPGTSQNDKRNFDGMPYRDVCAKCGAIRIDDQIGLEQTPDDYVQKLVQVFREVRRVLKDDGTLWLNLGDSYAGGNQTGRNDGGRPEKDKGWAEYDIQRTRINRNDGMKQKDLVGIPWMVAFALRADGWYLRSDIIWHKPNPMPESVKDRPTKAHEYLFLLSKSKSYYYDYEAIMEEATGYDGRKDTKYKGGNKDMAGGAHERWSKRMPPIGGVKAPGNNGNPTYSGNTPEWPIIDGIPARNKRSVWTINTKGFSGAHFAVMPEKLVEPCILAGSRPGDTVLDPFVGSGTVGAVSVRHGRDFIGIDLNDDYLKIAEKRIRDAQQQMRLPLEAE
jgi:DNA modification methylase